MDLKIPIPQQTNLLAFSTSPPPCYLCSRPSTLRIVQPNNPNGNAGRPYFKCIPCDRFLVFADARGNHATNPPCACGVPSKMQAASAWKGRVVHFVCRLGQCRFYEVAENGLHRMIVVRSGVALWNLIQAGVL